MTYMRIQRVVPVLAEGSCRSATPVFKGVQIGPSLKLQEEKREGEDDARTLVSQIGLLI